MNFYQSGANSRHQTQPLPRLRQHQWSRICRLPDFLAGQVNHDMAEARFIGPVVFFSTFAGADKYDTASTDCRPLFPPALKFGICPLLFIPECLTPRFPIYAPLSSRFRKHCDRIIDPKHRIEAEISSYR